MGSRVSINTHANICTKQTQRKRMLGEVLYTAAVKEERKHVRANGSRIKTVKKRRDGKR